MSGIMLLFFTLALVYGAGPLLWAAWHALWGKWVGLRAIGQLWAYGLGIGGGIAALGALAVRWWIGVLALVAWFVYIKVLTFVEEQAWRRSILAARQETEG